MKKIPMIFFFLLLVFASCTQNREENNHGEKLMLSENEQKNQMETIFITDSEFIGMIKQIYNDDDYLNMLTELPSDTILYDSNELAVGRIPKNTVVTVLACNNDHHFRNYYEYPYTYCLIKINSMDKAWTGWIRQDSLNQTAKSLLSKSERILWLSRYQISPDNTMIVWKSSNYNTDTGEICVFDNKGNLLFYLKDEQVFQQSDPKYAQIISGYILGWSDDSKNIWVDYDGKNYYVYVQPLQKTYELLEKPSLPYFLFHNSAIDNNKGDLYYTDYDGGIDNSRSGEEYWNEYMDQVFHLYKINLFTKEITLLESAYGTAFSFFKKNNIVTLYKTNHFTEETTTYENFEKSW